VTKISYLFSLYLQCWRGVEYLARSDRRFNFSLAPKKDPMFTGTWGNYLLA
jgi:hypothetical protein